MAMLINILILSTLVDEDDEDDEDIDLEDDFLKSLSSSMSLVKKLTFQLIFDLKLRKF